MVQNKKIEEHITREGLSPNKQTDMNTMAAIKHDIKSFFQGLPSMGALPANFALGSSSATSFS